MKNSDFIIDVGEIQPTGESSRENGNNDTEITIVPDDSTGNDSADNNLAQAEKEEIQIDNDEQDSIVTLNVADVDKKVNLKVAQELNLPLAVVPKTFDIKAATKNEERRRHQIGFFRKQNNRIVFFGRRMQNQYGSAEYGIANAPEENRSEFVKFVLIIVLTMLMATATITVFVFKTPALYSFFQRASLFLLIFGTIGLVSLNYAIMCSNCTRSPPCNYICLFFAVVFMSIITSCVTVRFRTEILMYSLAATTVTVMICIGLAMSNIDFTKCMIYVFVISIALGAVLMIVAIASMVMKQRFTIAMFVILLLCTVVNVIILIMELQMILGGKTVQLEESDYAIGAFMVYTSIVDLFLKFVQLFALGEEVF